jgi:hypothetical protein
MSEHEMCDRCYLPCEPFQKIVHIKGHPRHEECHMAMRPPNWRDLAAPVFDSRGRWVRLARR